MKQPKFISKIPKPFRNKYVLTIIIFLIWMIFFDSNNIINRIKEKRMLNKLEEEKEYYLQKEEREYGELRELQTDNNNLEKYAREQYKMKNPDEDIYIIVSPKEQTEEFSSETTTYDEE
ncbi:MAG: septum formation initiator family protein [Bacteroidales bacterium]|nr:septum formation initiator family protein [Bacteroidales bacterium]